MIAIPATPAPAPIPAFSPVERPDAAGCTGNWSAKTTFTIAEVGFWVVEEKASVFEVLLLLVMSGTDTTVCEVTGTAGGIR